MKLLYTLIILFAFSFASSESSDSGIIEEIQNRYDNGRLRFVKYYKRIPNNQEIIKSRRYYQTGQIWEETNYKNGKEDKYTEYYETGQINREGIYNNGDRYLINAWDKDGKVVVENGNGKLTSYFQNGQIRSEENFKNGKNNGVWIFYTKTGDVLNTGNAIDGNLFARDSTDFEYFDDDITIEDTDFDSFDDWGAPPQQDAAKFRFIPFDKPPKQRVPIKPIYPKIAQEAGIEGTVYVQFFIDIKGNVSQVIVTKGMPNTGLDEAAITAVKKSKWYPAQQRDKKVGVWQTIPVVFTLQISK